MLDAAVKLVARRGLRGATVRSIAQAAGVTDAALYRHYRSKDELCRAAYAQIVTEMIEVKRRIAASDRPVRDKLSEWIRVSYRFFDEHPDSFTFVLLTPPDERPAVDTEVSDRQGAIFMELIREAQAAGHVRPMPPELALSHFTGVMLNVPRLINAGVLPAPASQYADAVAEAVWRMLRADEGLVSRERPTPTKRPD